MKFTNKELIESNKNKYGWFAVGLVFKVKCGGLVIALLTP
ncbi:hypothetical protein VCRA2121O391_300017 [Vibrio crassostreae]|nr:hypothetical protein VCRA2117O378_320017 [Vibrio crassostreae]CAK2142936.1 hypothetical protein VCRA2113O356_490017 [Vibrio crassostreae]CAK2348777.1 hypothetical protein VCRA2119O386_340017 [Vibrio crassostreae]CAK2749213.1 hypothetical protein VCRA2117O375_290017 [Vibrio crassostreae]CAK2865526.1 hypothetical protein VCRA2121O391_300017 [Vibrio crassostreae]